MSNFNSASDCPTPVNFATFNQDCTSLAIGTKTGYKIFSLNAVDSLELIYENVSDSIFIVERLFSSSLLVVVHTSSPRTLRVSHFRKDAEICNYCYSNSILAVKLNRARLVVALEGSLHIHNIRDMKVLHTIKDTPANPAGLLTLSISTDNCFLGYPGSSNIGEVQIFDAGNLHAKTMIPAHDSPLAALMFCPNGRMLSTASEKGTVIRVFLVQDGTKLYEFRRGVKRCVSISSLIFSTDSNYLCCSSNTETVHVFKLEDLQEPLKQNPEEDVTSWMGLFSKAMNVTSSYLPTQVTEVLTQGRAFATVHLPFYGLRNSCAITSIQKVLRLLVASSDGFLYIYNLDGAEGGTCTLVKKHSLLEKDLTSATTPMEPDSGSINTYAGILRGKSSSEMSGTTMDSDKAREITLATESPTKGGFTFDENEFPPVNCKPE